MSVDSPILGISTVAGLGGGAASVLADTGNPLLVGVVVGALMLIVLGFVTRAAQQR
ncbi:MAG: hypothetical protein ACREGJ_03270 [Candidatus Saccharimonadales bacterium]